MPRRTVDAMGPSGIAATKIWLSLWLLLTLAALARGAPVPQENDESSGPLPFLQFTKGGIRVNFGGYHAQAGLGGLLSGRREDGGLHASAGTPSGAHASAGLGGSLDGGPVGGLHARAGLGNGGPEAEAGLGGSLAGPKPEGELFASSSANKYANIDLANKIDGPERSKNIQVISRTKKETNQAIEPLATSVVLSSTDAKEPSSSASSGVTANAAASASNGGGASEAKSQQHPARWYFEKRLRERVGPAYTTSTTTTATPTAHNSHNAIAAAETLAEAPAAGGEKGETTAGAGSTTTTARTTWRANNKKQQRPVGIFARATAEVDSDGETRRKSTLFDDIFNIPISALNAVNQLLRNHVGKK